MIMSFASIPADLYSSATLRKVFKKSPSPNFMILALWMQVTFCASRRVMFKSGTVVVGTHLPVVLEGKVKSEARDTFCFGFRHDFQAFDDTGITLMLQPRVFTLGIFTYNGKIDVGVTSRESRQGLAEHNRGIDVELLTHGDVP